MSGTRFDSESVLPQLSDEQEAELAQALRGAALPPALDRKLNELLIEQALTDPLAPPNEQEIAESERLRDALATGSPHPDLELATALAVAHRPPSAQPKHLEELSERALATRRSAVIYVAFGVGAGVAALAAAIALFVAPVHERSSVPGRQEPLALSRSTAAMFHSPFETGETTARLDRIAVVRERELRANRYALWGVSR